MDKEVKSKMSLFRTLSGEYKKAEAELKKVEGLEKKTSPQAALKEKLDKLEYKNMLKEKLDKAESEMRTYNERKDALDKFFQKDTLTVEALTGSWGPEKQVPK